MWALDEKALKDVVGGIEFAYLGIRIPQLA